MGRRSLPGGFLRWIRSLLRNEQPRLLDDLLEDFTDWLRRLGVRFSQRNYKHAGGRFRLEVRPRRGRPLGTGKYGRGKIEAFVSDYSRVRREFEAAGGRITEEDIAETLGIDPRYLYALKRHARERGLL